ncbi:ParA family protein [Campylobacter sp. faydin G-140]|uniref:ParA family protein n=1 Tax=Campylobacter anatolicus TaxID=2829105 RepID=UPI001B970E74|nr:ParA family protein [Campylobacter anatolicus]MBR8466488.1 ParA family protein [Campylobacter anatolicus]
MIIVFSHPKGGVGKTLLSFNYAIYNKLNNGDITVIDLDGQHSISNFNNIRNAVGLKPVLDILQFKEPNEFLSYLKTVDENKKIIIDTGGFDSAFNRIALAFSDIIITPVSDSPVEIMRLLDFDRILNEISKNINRNLKTYIVINRIHPSLTNLNFIKNPLRGKERFKFLDSIVRDRARIKFSVAQGGAVFEDDGAKRDEKAISELTDLFNEIENIIIAQKTKE